MTTLKTGTRLRSQVDETQVVVIRAPAGEVDVLIGGHPVIDAKSEPAEGLTLDPALSDGTQLGKRYVREEGDLELLVSKGGQGTLTVDGTPLVLKDAKPLPASD
ncbi:MAG: hypothetical protein JWL64_2674 [Frankiales bacterium]|nr:hypothetical protein [Frankiales bacterium]